MLRVPGDDTALLGIDRANEYRAASVAADAGVGPEVVAFLPDTGCFVTRFVEGATSRWRTCAATTCSSSW